MSRSPNTFLFIMILNEKNWSSSICSKDRVQPSSFRQYFVFWVPLTLVKVTGLSGTSGSLEPNHLCPESQ